MSLSGEEVLRSTLTEAYRERNANTITPRERLINFCELQYIIHGVQPSGIPSEAVVKFIVRTPYKYWGLPSDGGTSNSIVMRCTHFRDEDATWIMQNFATVQPYFAEVAKSFPRFSFAMEGLMNEVNLNQQGIFTKDGIKIGFAARQPE